jgi:hypothetical protein
MAHTRHNKLASYIKFECINLFDFVVSTDNKYDCIFCMIGGDLQEIGIIKLLILAGDIHKNGSVYVRSVVIKRLESILKEIDVIKFHMYMYDMK